jgi:hypothetical protein
MHTHFLHAISEEPLPPLLIHILPLSFCLFHKIKLPMACFLCLHVSEQFNPDLKKLPHLVSLCSVACWLSLPRDSLVCVCCMTGRVLGLPTASLRELYEWGDLCCQCRSRAAACGQFAKRTEWLWFAELSEKPKWRSGYAVPVAVRKVGVADLYPLRCVLVTKYVIQMRLSVYLRISFASFSCLYFSFSILLLFLLTSSSVLNYNTKHFCLVYLRNFVIPVIRD